MVQNDTLKSIINIKESHQFDSTINKIKNIYIYIYIIEWYNSHFTLINGS